MEKLKDLNEIKHDLINAVKMEIAGGLENADTEELGQVIDMIKDLAEAEESCMEAAYYELVSEAMDGGESERMGYDKWRYSSGRFAPKGRGHISGYLPTGNMIPEYHAEPMGYTDGKSTMSGRYGYSDDKTKSDKERMDKAVECMGDIWTNADHEMRMKLKTCVQDLLYQMEQSE